jgi:chlorophyll synthase
VPPTHPSIAGAFRRPLGRGRIIHSTIATLLFLSLSLSQPHYSSARTKRSPILYSIAGLGIAIVNDFKSVEGDRQMGLNSLPVAFGIDGAKWICAGSVTLTQLGVAAYLYSIGESTYAAIILGLILPQVYFQATLLLPDPVGNDVKYQASSQPFFVFGILATALCLGHHDFSV